MTLHTQLPIDRRRSIHRQSAAAAHRDAQLFRRAPRVVQRAESERRESLDDFTAAAHESIVQEVLRFGTIQGEQL